jgi:hypothetical protein
MKNNTKKWIAVAGCLAVCVVLAVLIGSQLQKKPVTDEPFQSQEPMQTDVTVQAPQAETKNEVSVTSPDTSSPADTDNGAVSSGTEQTIQKDASKPEYTENSLPIPRRSQTAKRSRNHPNRWIMIRWKSPRIHPDLRNRLRAMDFPALIMYQMPVRIKESLLTATVISINRWDDGLIKSILTRARLKNTVLLFYKKTGGQDEKNH